MVQTIIAIIAVLGIRAAEPAGAVSALGEHLHVFAGPVNVGIVRDGEKALLIDCGDGRVAGVLPALGVTTVDRILFTHHHRDQACGAPFFRGARLVVPAAERAYFDDVESYWNDPKSRWHIYNVHPHHLMLGQSVEVDETLAGGDRLAWGPARIRAIDTPGHTDGSISLLVEVDGRRVVFSGDAIYDRGQVWDVHSLQKGTQTTDYHGFLGAAPVLRESLARILAQKPEILVPSHGVVMRDPAAAIGELGERLETCYDKYVAISALRYYFPKLFTAFAGRKDHLPIEKGKAPPPFLRHVGTSWIFLGEEKAAFVSDCGSTHVIDALKGWLADGTIRSVEGLWVTHYHDDHVDAIPEFQKAFDCPCYADRSVAQVIANPIAWRIPCISPSKARVDRVTEDGESWTWRGFRMTACHLPGQTLYHGGLLVEGQGARVLLAGDSFTPAGIDDYCAHNRNWLGAGVGFDRAIARIEEWKPTHILNCHVDVAWAFTAEACRFMRANLAEREKLFGALVPWDHANYGLDEAWVRCFPYEQEAAAGAEFAIDVIVTNHAPGIRAASARAVPQWSSPSEWREIEIPAKRDGAIRLRFRVPADAKPGRYVVPFDLRHGGKDLPQFTEAIVVVRSTPAQPPPPQ
ncbi:MAG: MBL fold metallo-hydrolase [Planctomycetes bacterium]|nr:MBL fold metallo-hydrolase [Planctomycetota bacterium]